MFEKKNDAAAELKVVLAAKAVAQTKIDRLRAARAKAVLAINDADLKLRRATAAVEAARNAAADEAATALADGNAAAPLAGLAKLRNEIANAEDEKAVATGATNRLGDLIATAEAEMSALPVHRAVCEAMAPKLRKLLDKAYEARSTLDQANAELSLLFARRVFPAEMDMEIGTTLGFHFTDPPGSPGSPIRAPDTRKLEAAIEQMRDNPDAVLAAL